MNSGLATEDITFLWALIPLGSIFTVVIGGALVDRYGERKVGAVSLAIASLFAVGRAFSYDLMSLKISLFGFGAAISSDSCFACQS